MPDAPFRLIEPTDAKLDSVTLRNEHHGEELVPAISLGISITGPNTLLDLISPVLRQTLYTTADGGATPALEGIDAPTPKLRTKLLGSLPLRVPPIEGGTLFVEFGIGEDMEFASVRLDKWRAECLDGGSVTLSFRAGTSQVGETQVGHLFGDLGQVVTIRFEPPALAEGKPDTDGGAPLFEPTDTARAATDAVIADAKKRRGRSPKGAARG